MSHNTRYLLRLTSRDLELFTYLFHLKGAARHQINRDVFGNVSRSVLHDRLTKLVKYGYLEKGLCDYGGSRTCYFSTMKGLESLGLSGDNLERRELKSASPKHDFFLVDVRAKLLSAPCLIQYLTENQLRSRAFNDKGFNYQSFRELHSDGFLRIKIGQGEFSGAIEYEQNNKGIGRYEPLFYDYYASANVAFVIYICHSLSFQKTLMKAEKSVRGKKDSKFFFITQSEFQDSHSVISFKNTDSGSIDIHLNEKPKNLFSELST